jgi:hypothetical protein
MEYGKVIKKVISPLVVDFSPSGLKKAGSGIM